MPTRRSVLTGLALGLSACSPTAGAATEDAPEPIAELLKSTGAPALGGAVVTRDGIAWLEVGGVRRQDQPDLVQRTDKWHVGSNAKAMTAALSARLAEDGLLRLDAPLTTLLPSWVATAAAPGWNAVTLESLLCHRSGLRDSAVLGPARVLAALADERAPRTQREAFAARVTAEAPTGPAGAFSYSNAGYILAGAVLERIADRPFEDLMRERLFAPLGMTQAGFGAPRGAQPRGHARLPLGIGHRVMGETDDNPPLLAPAGTVHLPLEDHARFVRLFLTDGGGYLPPSAISNLTRARGAGAKAYALGWGVRPDLWGRGPALAHEGSNTMWHALAAMFPSRGVAVLSVSNDHARGEVGCRELARRLAERFIPA